MKGFAVTHQGIEDLCKEEIKHLISCKNLEAAKRTVVFDLKSYEDLFLLCYRSQTASKIGLFLGMFHEKKDHLQELVEFLVTLDLTEWISAQTKVSIQCIREGDHLFTSQDVTQTVSGCLKKRNIIIDYKHSDITLFIFIADATCLLGIDFSGKDLSKREYRIFINQRALKGPLAYSLFLLGDVKMNELVIDPFMKSGEIIIEGGLRLLEMSPWYYQKEDFGFLTIPKFSSFDYEKFFLTLDKKVKKKKTKLYGYDSLMRNVVAANKNGKISGIHKFVSLSRIDIDWIDLKFKEGEVDKIITQLPPLSKRSDPSQIRKLYDHFFNQSAYLLKKDGIIVAGCLTTDLILDIAEHYHFVVTHTRTIWQGEQAVHVFVFGKGKGKEE